MIVPAFLLMAALAPAAALVPSASAAPALPSEATVVLKDEPLAFEAKSVVLQLSQQGTATVTWKWDNGSTKPHNVKHDEGSFNSHPGCGEAGLYGLGTGLAQCGFTSLSTFTQAFSKAGTYSYHCAIHGGPGQGMAGTVVVKAAPTAK